MAELGKAEQIALEVVAAQFSAKWQSGDGRADAYLTLGSRRIALDVVVMASQPLEAQAAKARLREDVVAQRVLRDIESALCAHVPAGKTIILTLGAPIKVPKKLVASLAATLLAYLESGAEEADEKKTVLGNRVRFRVLKHASRWNAKVIGFVFTGDPEPRILAGVMRSLHDEIVAKAKRRRPRKFAGDRWLVLVSDQPVGDIKTYRRAYSLLSPPNHFSKILMVLDGGRVEVLAER